MPLVFLLPVFLYSHSVKAPKVLYALACNEKKKKQNDTKKNGSVEKSDIRKSNGNMHLHKYKLCSCLLILGSMKCLKKNVFEEPPLMPISLGQN